MHAARRIVGDWYPGPVPASVAIEEGAYVETAHSFRLLRDERGDSVRIARGASVYLGTTFDVGPRGRVAVGEFSLLNVAWIVCDAEVSIGPYAMVSWDVAILDTCRLPAAADARRASLERVASSQDRRLRGEDGARPVRIGRAAWIGFGATILPGVTVGDGAIVGARSVVASDVPPFAVAAGNPARVVRELPREDLRDAR